jgi:hypothetical protein
MEKHAKDSRVGDVLEWDDYERNPAIDGLVKNGDHIFLVTVRDVSEGHAVG